MSDRGRTKRHGEGFSCSHCKGWVSTSENIGTHHRNHCSSCLWSKHVDSDKPGDRKATCGAGMKPVGFTFKQEGTNKYGLERQGELMIIHYCSNRDCGKISINRIAGDDNTATIMSVFEESQTMDDNLRGAIAGAGIKLLGESDRKQIRIQLYGKGNC